jgi:hypothetical protein
VFIEPDRDQFFQYATFAVIGVTLVICLCYGLIFLNPHVLPGALQPAEPTVAVAVFQLPPTWTPTATQSPTPTNTNTPTDIPTNTPTNTPVLTATPRPTATFTATPMPPTLPPTPRPVIKPPPPPPPAPTATPRPSFVQIKYDREPNCGTWYVQGTVWNHGYGLGFVPGTRVRLWIDGGSYRDTTAGATGKNNPAYYEFILAQHTATSGRIGLVDDQGNLLTPQWYGIQLTSNCKGAGAVNEIILDFARQ